MAYTFSNRSLKNLLGVHPDLIKVCWRAIEITTQDFSIIEGRRSEERQKELYAKGKSKTLNSRHLSGHAVDLAPFPFDGDVDEDRILNIHDWDQYYPIAEAMKQAAAELGVALEWGGDWTTFKDGPHFQLSREAYPA